MGRRLRSKAPALERTKVPALICPSFSDHHGRPISLVEQQNREPAYLTLNPEGKVPLLLIDGRPLTEVAAILYYLARAYPESNLFPSGEPEVEAEVVSWMSFVASTIHPARRQGPEYSRTILALTESKLGGRRWVSGDRYSIADIHLFRVYWRFRRAFDLGPNEFVGLEALHTRMLARPAVARTLEIESALGYQPSSWSTK